MRFTYMGDRLWKGRRRMFWKKSKKQDAEASETNVIEEDIFEDMTEDENQSSESTEKNGLYTGAGEEEPESDTVDETEDTDYEENESEKIALADNIEDASEEADSEEECAEEEYEEEEYDEEDEEDDELEDFHDSEIVSEHKAHKVRKKKKVWKKLLLVFGILIGLVLLAYGAGVVFFSQYFYYGTVIDGQDYSLQQVEDVEAYQESVIAGYELTLVASDGSEEVITSDQMGLTYTSKSEITDILEEQDPIRWPEMFFYAYDYTTTISVSYDDDILDETIANLDCMDEENMIASTDAYPEYEGDSYVIVPYVQGTVINKTIFISTVKKSILSLSASINLEELDCYEVDAKTEESDEVISLTDSLNSMLQGTITYSEGNVIDTETIASWIVIGEDDALSLDGDAIKTFVSDLADEYNTVGTTRTFTSGSGKTVEVSGGSYGWTVNESEEIAQIKADILAGEAVEREITYSSRGLTHGDSDWGDTYAEIDLTNQKVYFINDGEVVVSGDVVTGDVDGGNATPQGVYSLTYKTTNAVLRGTQYADGTYEYESPVSFWMPFNGGIGMHDASWRSTFGGTIYKTSGSHGCINMSYSTAQAIYSYISSGDPVICHY